MLMPTSTYLYFQVARSAKAKTYHVYVYSKNSEILLGTVKWFGRWRQYAFFPEQETVFNTNCLEDIRKCIAALRSDRLAERDLT